MLQFLALLLWAFSFSAMALGTIYAWCRIRSHSSPDPSAPQFPVSILKPLKGVDSGLHENLETFFRLDYPCFELLFCFESTSDPALSLVRGLIRDYPEVRTRLFISQSEVGPNPKINNMLAGYDAAQHDVILISDSNVRVSPHLLTRLTRELTRGTGVVTAVVAGQSGEGLGGRLETMFLNTFFARWMWIAQAFGRASVLGKTMMFRKSDAERFGGLRLLGRYVAEDYQTGCAMERMGLGVQLASEPVTQFVGRHGVTDFWKRHVRWCRIRKSQVFSIYLLESLQGVLLSGVLGGLAASSLWGLPFGWFFVWHSLIWAACDLCLNTRLEGRFSFRSVWVWGVRELLAFPLWLYALFGSTIEWRGKRYAVLRGGLLDGWRECDNVLDGEFCNSIAGRGHYARSFSLGNRDQRAPSRRLQYC